jgi:hypothetical protein
MMFNDKKILVFSLSIILSITPAVHAKRPHHEKWYQDRWCSSHNGQTEYVLPDRTRVDCLTQTHAIEFDFANKWAESIGQSLYYSSQTGKRAGIVIVAKKGGGARFLIRLKSTIKHFNLPIDVWVIKEGD